MDYALKFLEKDIYSLYSQVNDLFRLSKVNILDYKNYLLYSLYSQDTFFGMCQSGGEAADGEWADANRIKK